MQFVYPKFAGGSDKTIRAPYVIVDLENGRRLQYVPKFKRGRHSKIVTKYDEFVHIGQRKLLLGEIQHLAAHCANAAVVIYAGAAPSNKAYILHKLFPRVKFLFVDPQPFNIYINNYGDSHTKYTLPEIIQLDALDDSLFERFYSEGSIYLYNAYFTDATAEFCKRLYEHRTSEYDKFIFWSDIRTAETDEMPSDLDVLWNSAMMYNWCCIMQPDYAMLKFRCPYLESPVDFTLHQEDFAKAPKIQESVQQSGNFAFFKGEIHVQAWAGRSSTETRLWVNREDIVSENLIVYNRLAYEETLFCYNMIDRVCGLHENPHADAALHFDHCGDCALEAHIWHTYKTNINPGINIKKCIKLVEKFTGKSLDRAGHGKLFA